MSAGIIAAHYAEAAGASLDDTILGFSPVSYWKLGEASGTAAVDAGSAALDGTYTGSPTLGKTSLIPSDAATCVGFASASSQYVACASNAAYNFTNATMTVLMFIKPTSSLADKFLASRDGSNGNRGWQFRVVSAKLRFTILNTAGNVSVTADSAASLPLDAVSMVAGTFDGTTGFLRSYINGSLDGSTDGSTFGTQSPATGVSIGRLPRDNTRHFNGDIQKVALFGSALSAANIADIYAASGL